MSGKRRPWSGDVEKQVLVASRRRCCTCYYVGGIKNERRGQLCHIGQDPSRSTFDDAVWLCLEHHDEFDGKTSQSKGLTEKEVRHYRDKLYDELEASGVGDAMATASDIEGGIGRDVSTAVEALEAESYQIGQEMFSALEVFERVGKELLPGKSPIIFRADVAQAFNLSPPSLVDERPILQHWVLIGIVDTPERVEPGQAAGPQTSTGSEGPYDRYMLSALGKKTLNNLRQQERRLLKCRPYVAIDSDYGTEHGTAAYVLLKVANPIEAQVLNARARLVSIKPTSNQKAIAATPVLNYPSGLLQWSARYGAGEVATFARECELDVLAFENNDQNGVIVYANEAVRGKYELMLDAAEAWEITVEVFADSGERGSCRFQIRRGKETVFATASRRGTLYEPELEEIH